MGWLSHLTEEQKKWWNEGYDLHPQELDLCPYEPGTDAYAHFEDGWWVADNNY